MGKYILGCGALALIGIVLILIFGGLMWADSYNKLVALKQGVDAQWAEVENQYERRADLIPNLVQTVSGAANFEKSTLTDIAEARASVGQVKLDPNQAPSDPAQLQKFEQAQGALGNALSRLLVVSERYPELKANQNFVDLQAQLEGTENRITTARNHFNQAAPSLQHQSPEFPHQLHRWLLRLYCPALLPSEGRKRYAAASPLRFQLFHKRRPRTLTGICR